MMTYDKEEIQSVLLVDTRRRSTASRRQRSRKPSQEFSFRRALGNRLRRSNSRSVRRGRSLIKVEDVASSGSSVTASVFQDCVLRSMEKIRKLAAGLAKARNRGP